MNDAAPVSAPLQITFPWKNLIGAIASGKVIPVIGPDVHTFGGSLLYKELAKFIAANTEGTALSQALRTPMA
jgi:hypothetical protein